ncbi:MAG: hypothetical protein ACI8Z7_000367 [Candidatus Nanohaloarchaea archaeon]|jgi:hypothetical protein
MSVPSLTAGTLAAYGVVAIFVITTIFFVLNKLGIVRNDEDDPGSSRQELADD